MTTTADRTIAALRANHEELAGRVRTFQDDDLGRQSGAAEWDVAQVLSHLGSGAEITLAGLRAGTEGTPAPDRDFNPSVWRRWDAMGPREKADGFLDSNASLVDYLEQLDETKRRDLQLSLGFLPFPIDVAVFAGMRLNEAALHGWDARAAFDQRATLLPGEADVLLELLTGPMSFLVGFMGKAEVLGATQARLLVRTTDPEREIGLLLGAEVSLGEPPAEPDGVLTIPAEAFLRLLSGRLGPVYTPETVTLDSDTVSMANLRDLFAGF